MRPLEQRDYQNRIVQKTVAAFTEENYTSILIESPTGSGKTLMGLSALKLLQEADPGIQFGWVAMRRKLLAQAEEENKRVGVRNIRFISMFDSSPGKCDMIIIDECQHDAAATMANLHKMLGARWSLGLSATPQRTDRVKLSFQKTIRDCGVRFLIEQGYLAPFDQYVIPEWTPQTIAARLIAEPGRWGKSVVFFLDKEDCWQLHSLLRGSSVTSAVMLGSMRQEEREPLYEAFESGGIQVLINVILLTEGFDAPALRTVWVRDGSKLPTMQMSGRVLRKDFANPDKVAQIVQSAGTNWLYPKCVQVKPKRQYLWQDDRWLSLEPSDKIERANEQVRQHILTKKISLPAYLSGQAKRVVSLRMTQKGKLVTTTAVDRNPDTAFLSFEAAQER